MYGVVNLRVLSIYAFYEVVCNMCFINLPSLLSPKGEVMVIIIICLIMMANSNVDWQCPVQVNGKLQVSDSNIILCMRSVTLRQLHTSPLRAASGR